MRSAVSAFLTVFFLWDLVSAADKIRVSVSELSMLREAQRELGITGR